MSSLNSIEETIRTLRVMRGDLTLQIRRLEALLPEKKTNRIGKRNLFVPPYLREKRAKADTRKRANMNYLP